MGGMKKTILLSVVLLCAGITAGLASFIGRNPSVNSFKQSGAVCNDPMSGDLNGHSRSPGQDTVLYLDQRKILIKTPVNSKKAGTFLVLPGWNFPPEDWCNKTSLCEKVLKKGYYIVLPDMGKSIYQERIFPETRVDWRSWPTRKWVTDTLIPFLQKKYSLFLGDENNFIVGLSTGARGVALIVLDMPSLFKGAAALSGDYNQLGMPGDNLITGYYGPYVKFRDRWTKTDNVLYRIKEFRTPVYLGHGTSDKVVPPAQTRFL
jgi:hypothetical protein